jgi:hypothetical protein
VTGLHLSLPVPFPLVFPGETLREGQHFQARRPPIEIRVRVQEQDQELDEVHHETFELLQVVFLFGQLGHSDRVGGVHFVLQIGDSLDHVCETAVVPGDDLLVVAHQLALEARRRRRHVVLEVAYQVVQFPFGELFGGLLAVRDHLQSADSHLKRQTLHHFEP